MGMSIFNKNRPYIEPTFAEWEEVKRDARERFKQSLSNMRDNTIAICQENGIQLWEVTLRGSVIKIRYKFPSGETYSVDCTGKGEFYNPWSEVYYNISDTVDIKETQLV
jgi:hypothetical protein